MEQNPTALQLDFLTVWWRDTWLNIRSQGSLGVVFLLLADNYYCMDSAEGVIGQLQLLC